MGEGRLASWMWGCACEPPTKYRHSFHLNMLHNITYDFLLSRGCVCNVHGIAWVPKITSRAREFFFPKHTEQTFFSPLLVRSVIVLFYAFCLQSSTNQAIVHSFVRSADRWVLPSEYAFPFLFYFIPFVDCFDFYVWVLWRIDHGSVRRSITRCFFVYIFEIT